MGMNLLSRRKDDGHAPSAELSDHLADLLGERPGDGLLILTVGGGQGLWQLRVGQLQQVREEIQVRFV